MTEKEKASRKKTHKISGLGRRKTSRAKVFLAPGSGKVVVNQKTPEEYFCKRVSLLSSMLEPFRVTGTEGKFDIEVFLSGGGVSAQADAIKMGIARALLEFDPELKQVLRRSDMLRRDPRMKERKKYGLKRARKAFQYTKR
ncbi:MAG: 30S ribosomal protein S9 [Candidatus Margulisiibacteriota bacterium]|nr:30S ribosomal protein S9 [Candidatus Margulisiibacteriota bacterium]